jgi:hypothetical protein
LGPDVSRESNALIFKGRQVLAKYLSWHFANIFSCSSYLYDSHCVDHSNMFKEDKSSNTHSGRQSRQEAVTRFDTAPHILALSFSQSYQVSSIREHCNKSPSLFTVIVCCHSTLHCRSTSLYVTIRCYCAARVIGRLTGSDNRQLLD